MSIVSRFYTYTIPPGKRKRRVSVRGNLFKQIIKQERIVKKNLFNSATVIEGNDYRRFRATTSKVKMLMAEMHLTVTCDIIVSVNVLLSYSHSVHSANVPLTLTTHWSDVSVRAGEVQL